MQVPWHGTRRSTITMWPNSAQPRYELAVEHSAAADARAERQHHHRRARLAPAPTRHSANAAAFASFSIADRADRSARDMRVAEVEVVERDVDRRRAHGPCAGRSATGCRTRSPRCRRRSSSLDRLVERRQERRPATSIGVGCSRRRSTRAVPVDDPGQDLRAAEVDADDACVRPNRAATLLRRWRRERSPTASTEADARRAGCRSTRPRAARRANGRRPPRRRRPRVRRPRRPAGAGARGSAIVLLVVLVLLVVWAITGYLSFRSGVDEGERAAADAAGASAVLDAAERAAALEPDDDPDARPRPREHGRRRDAATHSDSIMLLRTDPDRHRLAYLSIPRDLRVPIPGLRRAEDQRGDADRRPGARVRTIPGFTGLRDQPRR